MYGAFLMQSVETYLSVSRLFDAFFMSYLSRLFGAFLMQNVETADALEEV